MKQVNKPKSHKNVLVQQFKQKSKELLKQQPKNYLVSSLRDNSFTLDISIFNPEDIIFMPVILSLPISKVHIFNQQPHESSPNKAKSNNNQFQIKSFEETPKFKEFVRTITSSLYQNHTIKILRIERVLLTTKIIKQLAEGIKKSKNLRELALVNCKLNEQHLEELKLSLSQNQSLITLDFSFNELCQVGGMIGHILSEHSRRRSEIIWMFNLRGETPIEDISNTGICEINLEKNQLNDKAVIELATFLKNDTWTKCINLKGNRIKNQGIKQLAIMLKNNGSLISMDLRQNEGLTRQFSHYIYKKLLLNMEKYKQKKQEIEKNREAAACQQNTPSKSNNISREPNYQQKSQVSVIKYRSLRGSQNFEGRYQSNQYSTIVQHKNLQRNNMTVDQKIQNQTPIKITNQSVQCSNCKQKTLKMLKLQKQNLDLALKLRKLRNLFLNKNIQISSIFPANGQNSIIQLISNKSNENDDEMLQRMEQIMLELTRIMESAEEQQTKQNISNPLDNPNSFSNTIQLYPHNSHLHQLSKEIEEDRLNAILQVATSLQHQIESISQS